MQATDKAKDAKIYQEWVDAKIYQMQGPDEAGRKREVAAWRKLGKLLR